MTQPVFRQYDRKALDAQYNNRAKVKDALEWHRLDKADFSIVTELERPDAPLSRAIRRQMGLA